MCVCEGQGKYSGGNLVKHYSLTKTHGHVKTYYSTFLLEYGSKHGTKSQSQFHAVTGPVRKNFGKEYEYEHEHEYLHLPNLYLLAYVKRREKYSIFDCPRYEYTCVIYVQFSAQEIKIILLRTNKKTFKKNAR